MDPTSWNAPFWLVCAALFVIVMLRANGTYWLGRLAARGATHTRLARLMAKSGYQRACRQIDDFGAPVVTLSFLTVGFQTLVNLAAGTTRMSLRRYLPAVTVGSVIWALIYATIGTLGVDLALWLWQTSPQLTLGVAVVAATGLVGYVWWRRRHRKLAPMTD